MRSSRDLFIWCWSWTNCLLLLLIQICDDVVWVIDIFRHAASFGWGLRLLSNLCRKYMTISAVAVIATAILWRVWGVFSVWLKILHHFLQLIYLILQQLNLILLGSHYVFSSWRRFSFFNDLRIICNLRKWFSPLIIIGLIVTFWFVFIKVQSLLQNTSSLIEILRWSCFRLSCVSSFNIIVYNAIWTLELIERPFHGGVLSIRVIFIFQTRMVLLLDILILVFFVIIVRKWLAHCVSTNYWSSHIDIFVRKDRASHYLVHTLSLAVILLVIGNFALSIHKALLLQKRRSLSCCRYWSCLRNS